MNQLPWHVKPAESAGEGRAVSASRLARGIAAGEVGELDLVRGPGESSFVAVGDHQRMGDYLPPVRRKLVIEAEEAESDMTPMIDVTFQLVIFFMIAATFTVQKTLELPSTKPNPDGASAVTMEELSQENIMVKIAGNGTILVDDQPTQPEAIEQSLRQAVRNNDSAELILDIEDDALHDLVVRVIDAAGAAQIEKVLFVSRVSSPTVP